MIALSKSSTLQQRTDERISVSTLSATSRVDARVVAASRDAKEKRAAADAFAAGDAMFEAKVGRKESRGKMGRISSSMVED